MTRDEYLGTLLDMQARYETLGKAIAAMIAALNAGCFTDPSGVDPATAPATADGGQTDPALHVAVNAVRDIDVGLASAAPETDAASNTPADAGQPT